MSTDNVKERIAAWIAPVLEEKEMFLVDIHFSMGRHLEVFIDSDAGVKISDCAEISRLIEKNLDGSGLVPDNYILDVSSPGMDNPLKVPRQYKKRIGRQLHVVLKDGKTLEGILAEAHDDRIILREEAAKPKKKKGKTEDLIPEANKEHTITYDLIKKAVLHFTF